MKRLVNEKKEALAAQYAAEATLRRVYADQKDDDAPPLESIIAPLEAEIKMHKNEVLQNDKTHYERALACINLFSLSNSLDRSITGGYKVIGKTHEV